MASVCASSAREPTQRQFSGRAFFAVSTLLFVVSALATIAWCRSMSAMGGMSMPGGWTLSMTWMRMPGQTWFGVAVGFLGMWMVMMAAMMLPSFIPMLWRYRRAVAYTRGMQLAQLSVLVSLGYFCVWMLFGMLVFPLGAALAAVEMQQPLLARAVPFAGAAMVLLAGAFQFTKWKSHYLACCRESPGHISADTATAWRHGLRLGVHCSYCCGGLMTILLIVGVMDLRAMMVVTAAITAERLIPNGRHVARIIGVTVMGSGLLLILDAVHNAINLSVAT